MKKTIIGLLLTITLVSSSFVVVFATHDTDPHIKAPDIHVVLTHDTDPH